MATDKQLEESKKALERDATDYKFWCFHHRESAKWLAIRIHQVLVEGDDAAKHILLGSLPAYLEEYANPALYHFGDTERKENEIETEATENS